jgi:hypothetical protein
MGNTVGIFGNVNHVETAIKQLLEAGIAADAVSLLAAGISGNQTVHGVINERGRPAMPAGGGERSVRAGIFDLLPGFALIWMPGAGPALAVGSISAGMAGGLTGAGDRAFTMALTDHGVPDRAAEMCAEAARNGSYVLIIETDSVEASGLVWQLLEDNGAVRVEAHAPA